MTKNHPILTEERWIQISWDYFTDGKSDEEVWENLYKTHGIYGIHYKQVRKIFKKFRDFPIKKTVERIVILKKKRALLEEKISEYENDILIDNL